MEDPGIQYNDRNAYEFSLDQDHLQITDLKKLTDSSVLQQTLQQYHQDRLKYKHLVDNAPDAIFVADVETGQIIEANNKAAELLGVPVDQIIGMHQSQVHPPEDAEKYKVIFQEHIQNNAARISEDIYVQHKDGKKVPVQINASVTQLGPQKVIFGIFRDMTEQQEVTNKLRRFTEAAFEGIVMHDRKHFVEANQQFLDMFGYTLEELQQKDNGSDLIAPGDREKVKKLMKSHRETPYEVICLKKDGTTFPAEFCAREININSAPCRIVAVKDLTEQQQSQQKLKALFESSQDCIIVCDRNYDCLYANHAAIDYVNSTRDKIVNKNMREGLAHLPDFMHLWMSRFDEVFRTGKPMRVHDTDRINNRTVYLESILSPICYPSGKIFAVGAVCRDVTEFKACEQRFKRLSEAAFEGICIHDNGLILDANQQFADMFGYPLDKIKGLSCPAIVAPQSLDTVKKCVQTGEEGPYEAFCLRQNGTIFPAEIHSKQYQQNGKTLSMAAFRDLSSQKEMEQQLADSEKKYEELYRNANIALYRTRISNGKMLLCNTAMATMIGFDSVEDCLGANFFSTDTYLDKNRRQVFLETLKKHKRVKDFEIEGNRLDGTKMWVAVTAEIFPEQGWIEGVIRDITVEKILTRREMEILKILLTGKSNKEIAYYLGRSVRTVEDHRSHIMQKLEVDNIVDLTRKAFEYEITPDGE
ncbi:MAG: PAS domain S-box protein [Planctomycetota bacterium]